MSRSKRKTPIFGYTTAETEKRDKRLANRAYRHRLKSQRPSENEVIPHRRELSNVWCFDKDGKRYVHRTDWPATVFRKEMRK
jgi:hypothetical protein